MLNKVVLHFSGRFGTCGWRGVGYGCDILWIVGGCCVDDFGFYCAVGWRIVSVLCCGVD